jgi:hypothetical protein
MFIEGECGGKSIINGSSETQYSCFSAKMTCVASPPANGLLPSIYFEKQDDYILYIGLVFKTSSVHALFIFAYFIW